MRRSSARSPARARPRGPARRPGPRRRAPERVIGRAVHPRTVVVTDTSPRAPGSPRRWARPRPRPRRWPSDRARRARRRPGRRGKSERRERAPRLGAHRGDVARRGHERAEPQSAHPSELAAKVRLFDLLVDRPDEPRRRRPDSTVEHRGVVADARRSSPGRRPPKRAKRRAIVRARSAGTALSRPRRHGPPADRASGNRTTNSVPCGSLSSMGIVPPCASTRRFTIDSPSPVPPYSRVDDESTW